eukprot:scaffold8995_cov139-Cylindrotheca_fusiformis.AAC.11
MISGGAFQQCNFLATAERNYRTKKWYQSLSSRNRDTRQQEEIRVILCGHQLELETLHCSHTTDILDATARLTARLLVKRGQQQRRTGRKPLAWLGRVRRKEGIDEVDSRRT